MRVQLEPLERELDDLCECCVYRLRLSVSESLHGLRRRFEWEVRCAAGRTLLCGIDGVDFFTPVSHSV